MKKQILSCFLIAVLLLSALPVVHAAENPFSDVREGSWYYNYVLEAYERGLFNGTSADTFSPDGTMTRAMLATVLYRMEGAPSAEEFSNPFSDVAAGRWYTNAVKWGFHEGIIQGMSPSSFEPDTPLTRQQLATLVYRVAVKKGIAKPSGYWEEQKNEMLSKMTDAKEISDFAKEAMAWAYASNILRGKSATELDPRGNGTRAEVAKILCAYLTYEHNALQPHIHDYLASSVVAPTCTENGYTLCVCSCGETVRRNETPATGHRFGDWVTVREPTADRDGEKQRSCTVCAAVETAVIEKTGARLSVMLDELSVMKNDAQRLAQVAQIRIDKTSDLSLLPLVRLCPNVELIDMEGIQISSEFLNSLTSTRELTVAVRMGRVDLTGVKNDNITTLALMQTKVLQLSQVTGLHNLQWLHIECVDGFEEIDYAKLPSLRKLTMIGQSISDYASFFEKIKSVQSLSLESCNLRDCDTAALPALTNLKELRLNHTYVEDISFLEKMPWLEGVQLPPDVEKLDSKTISSRS